MEIRELRIGNYVNTENGIKKVSNISGDASLSKFKPIQLTEEILLKCGFEERINSSMVKFWNKNNFTIYHEYYKHNVVDNLEWFFLSSADFDRLRIYSLHQLQNLYFALTNQELEINL